MEIKLKYVAEMGDFVVTITICYKQNLPIK